MLLRLLWIAPFLHMYRTYTVRARQSTMYTYVQQFATRARSAWERENESMFWQMSLNQIVMCVTSVRGSYFSNYISNKLMSNHTSTYIAKKVSSQWCFGTFWCCVLIFSFAVANQDEFDNKASPTSRRDKGFHKECCIKKYSLTQGSLPHNQ